MLNGTAQSDSSGIDPQLPDVDLHLDGGYGIQASVTYERALGKHAIQIGPFLRHWKIERSDSFIITNPDDPSEGIELFEPRNTTTELGLRLAFAF